MVIAVITDLVTLLHDSPNEPGMMFGIAADNKKSCSYIRRFQDVEHLWRPLRIWSVIEGQRDLVRAARSLVVERWELRKPCIFRG